MDISIITAFDKKQLIGKNNQLPWHIPEDLQYFKKTTLNHPIVMGRKTFESIGKALPSRTNIVISSTLQPQKDIILLSSPEQLFSLDIEKAFIIGGSSLYQYFLPKSHYLYITHIDNIFSGDTFFPEIDWEQWVKITETCFISNGTSCRFCLYQSVYKESL